MLIIFKKFFCSLLGSTFFIPISLYAAEQVSEYSPVLSVKKYSNPPLSFTCKDLLGAGPNIQAIKGNFPINDSGGKMIGVISGTAAYNAVNNTNYPLSTIVKVKSYYYDDENEVNGFVIGPHHIMTVGHSVYDEHKKLWANKISVIDEQNQEFNVQEVHGCLEFSKDPEHLPVVADYNRTSYDYAVLILNEPIGYKKGWLGLIDTDRMTFRESVYFRIPVKFSHYNYNSSGLLETQTGTFCEDINGSGERDSRKHNLIGYDGIQTELGDCGSPTYFDFTDKGSGAYAMGHHILSGPCGQRYRVQMSGEVINVLQNTWNVRGTHAPLKEEREGTIFSLEGCANFMRILIKPQIDERVGEQVTGGVAQVRNKRAGNFDVTDNKRVRRNPVTP